MGQGRSPVYNTRAMQHQNLFVFDIETMLDTDAVPSLTGFDDPDLAARRQELERYHLENRWQEPLPAPALP